VVKAPKIELGAVCLRPRIGGALETARRREVVPRWFLAALLISPPIALIILLIAPDLKKEREKTEEAALRTPCPFVVRLS
jgi:hypothetical protein